MAQVSNDHSECSSLHGMEKFCPHMGRLPDTAVVADGQLRALLAGRLQMAAIIMSAGLSGMVLRNLFLGLASPSAGWSGFVPQVSMVLVGVGTTVLLFARGASLSMRLLRGVEVVLFGAAAATLMWFQFGTVHFADPESLETISLVYFARMTVPWILLIQIYGLFVPNSWPRAATVIGVLAALPLMTALLSSLQAPLLSDALADGGAASMVIWIVTGAAAAIWGSHRFDQSRQETFDARRVGLYTLRKKLGEGGMGEVYLAEHQLLKRTCAMKVIRRDKIDDEQTITRFEKEVHATARLTHPNTVSVFDYGVTDDGSFYYVMEFLPGLNLEELVERYGPLPAERVVHLLRQVCSALSEAHSHGLIHRDIKPGNIFAAERGGLYDVAKLLDFGLVKSTTNMEQTPSLTVQGTFVGSPLYAPPESTVGDGELDQRSDIYSLGATAYQLLTGEPVFKSTNPMKVMFAHASQAPVPPSELKNDIPAELEAIIMRCLEKDPADRFADTSELEWELQQVPLPETWDQPRAKQWWNDNGFTDRQWSPIAETIELTTASAP